MVEAFRPAGGPLLRTDRATDQMTLIGVIDIPADETTLVVLASGDADRALEATRQLGLEPIRALEVRWRSADARQRRPTEPPC